MPGSPFNLRRGSRGSHQFTLRNGRGRLVGVPGSDRKPLVLQTYLDAQEHLPYADDSNAVTPMSEENGAIIVPVYYANLGSRHSSYTSHQSRISYTSHGDLLGGPTKEARLRGRSSRNSHAILQQPTSASSYADTNHKAHREYVSIGYENTSMSSQKMHPNLNSISLTIQIRFSVAARNVTRLYRRGR